MDTPSPADCTDADLLDEVVDATTISVRTGYAKSYVVDLTARAWWPPAMPEHRNAGRIWRWHLVLEALDQHLPQWRDRLPR